MNDTEHNKKQYSDIARFFFALVGVTLVLACMYDVFRAITENKFNLLVIASVVGYVGYVFSHAAYKGIAPSWYEDKSIFKPKDKTFP